MNKEKTESDTVNYIASLLGCDYEEAIEKEVLTKKWVEKQEDGIITTHQEKEYRPITIGRVMVALGYNCFSEWIYNDKRGNDVIAGAKLQALKSWQFLDTNGQETTLDDQSKETIEALYKLLK